MAGGLGQISDWQSLIIGRSLVTVTGSWRNWSGRWRTRFRWPRRLGEPAHEDCNLLTVFGTIIVNSARLCPWVSGLPWAGRPAFRITKTSEAVCVHDAVNEWAVGGQTSLPRRLSRSVIASVDLAGAEFARNAEYGRGDGFGKLLAPVRRLSNLVCRHQRRGLSADY